MVCSSMEIDVKFQYRYSNAYPKAIRLVENGLIDLKSLVVGEGSPADSLSLL